MQKGTVFAGVPISTKAELKKKLKDLHRIYQNSRGVLSFD